MQLPSLTQLQKKTAATFKRFPLSLISAGIAAAALISFIEFEGQNELFYLNKIAAVAVLGIPLFTVLPLIIKKKKWSSLIRLGICALAAVLLLVYYFILPDTADAFGPYEYYRYILYFIGIHLLVAIGPYWGEGQIMNFWQYNKILFLRILTAILFSGVLFIGLAAALGSVQFLFKVDIAPQRYLELFLVITGVFNTWFFLSGIPDPIQKLDSISTYPNSLKVFTRNVLLPLVTIYMVILYLYMVKIIAQWAWPEGWVSILILSFSIFGILAILLLYPLRNKDDYHWIKRFSKSYYIILLPLTILLILAIWRRISEYGFTVERYFVLALGLWLLGLVVYFIFNKKQNIKAIPVSLCIIAFVISFGPWGAFAVSERSQVNRLQTILQKNNILQNGSVYKATSPISAYDAMQISSILRYLNRTRNLSSLQPWVNIEFENDPKKISQLLGIKYYNSVEVEQFEETKRNTKSRQDYFYTDFNKTIATRSIDWFIRDLSYSSSDNSTAYNLGKQSLIIEQHKYPPHLQIYFENRKQQTININLKNIVRNLLQQVDNYQYELPTEEMMFKFSNQSLHINLYLNRIQWNWQKDTIDVENAYFMLGINTE